MYEQHKVQRILKRRPNKTGTAYLYKIKWENLPIQASTWQQKQNLSSILDMIKQYNQHCDRRWRKRWDIYGYGKRNKGCNIVENAKLQYKQRGEYNQQLGKYAKGKDNEGNKGKQRRNTHKKDGINEEDQQCGQKAKQKLENQPEGTQQNIIMSKEPQIQEQNSSNIENNDKNEQQNQANLINKIRPKSKINLLKNKRILKWVIAHSNNIKQDSIDRKSKLLAMQSMQHQKQSQAHNQVQDKIAFQAENQNEIKQNGLQGQQQQDFELKLTSVQNKRRKQKQANQLGFRKPRKMIRKTNDKQEKMGNPKFSKFKIKIKNLLDVTYFENNVHTKPNNMRNTNRMQNYYNKSLNNDKKEANLDAQVYQYQPQQQSKYNHDEQSQWQRRDENKTKRQLMMRKKMHNKGSGTGGQRGRKRRQNKYLTEIKNYIDEMHGSNSEIIRTNLRTKVPKNRNLQLASNLYSLNNTPQPKPKSNINSFPFDRNYYSIFDLAKYRQRNQTNGFKLLPIISIINREDNKDQKIQEEKQQQHGQFHGEIKDKQNNQLDVQNCEENLNIVTSYPYNQENTQVFAQCKLQNPQQSQYIFKQSSTKKKRLSQTQILFKNAGSKVMLFEPRVKENRYLNYNFDTWDTLNFPQPKDKQTIQKQKQLARPLSIQQQLKSFRPDKNYSMVLGSSNKLSVTMLDEQNRKCQIEINQLNQNYMKWLQNLYQSYL